MGTKDVLIIAAVAVGGFVLYTKLRPGFSAPPASSAPQAYTPPSPTSAPRSEQSTLDRVLGYGQQGIEVVKAGEGIFNTVRGWWS
jgi:hypothetical protein